MFHPQLSNILPPNPRILRPTLLRKIQVLLPLLPVKYLVPRTFIIIFVLRLEKITHFLHDLSTIKYPPHEPSPNYQNSAPTHYQKATATPAPVSKPQRTDAAPNDPQSVHQQSSSTRFQQHNPTVDQTHQIVLQHEYDTA